MQVPFRNFTQRLKADGFLAVGGTTGFGYKTGKGVGGAQTQITTRATTVVLNKLCGAITTDTTSLATAAEISFTVTNSKVAANDVVVACIKSGGTTSGSTWAAVTAVADGSFQISLANLHASVADTGAIVINFAVIKSSID